MAKKKDTPPKKDVKAKAAADSVETQNENNQEIQAPMLRILAQYTKDASFENPNAPDSLRADQAAPAININIEIGRQMLDDNTVEVVLMLGATAERDGKAVFLCELQYAGLFSFANVAEEHIQPMVLIECPRLLFPFARQIMAEMTQNGGYPPILLEPPDFAAMFRDEMMRRAAEQGDSPTVN
ncbi:MAG TPA: protein-export chaperone SecB [Hellea balneolensis]|uniref:Protein-export protein SecB n=1 Tax=Hellea balneolensis TaxID=287478 RepID=A0A7C3G7S7_9PROT|nr:protein-export chaperone SecB [Hellea balneolensis]